MCMAVNEKCPEMDYLGEIGLYSSVDFLKTFSERKS